MHYGKVSGGERPSSVHAAKITIINSGRSKDNRAMHLIRCLPFFLFYYDFIRFAEHLSGKDNTAADALSRNNLSLFHQQVNHAAKLPTQLPWELTLALIIHQPNWTSENWTVLFSTIIRVPKNASLSFVLMEPSLNSQLQNLCCVPMYLI